MEASYFVDVRSLKSLPQLKATMTAYEKHGQAICKTMEGLKQETCGKIHEVVNSRNAELKAHIAELEAIAWKGLVVFLTILLTLLLAYLVYQETVGAGDNTSPQAGKMAEEELNPTEDIEDQLPTDILESIGQLFSEAPVTDQQGPLSPENASPTSSANDSALAATTEIATASCSAQGILSRALSQSAEEQPPKSPTSHAPDATQKITGNENATAK